MRLRQTRSHVRNLSALLLRPGTVGGETSARWKGLNNRHTDRWSGGKGMGGILCWLGMLQLGGCRFSMGLLFTLSRSGTCLGFLRNCF